MILIRTNDMRAMESVYRELGVFNAEHQNMQKANRRVEDILQSGLLKTYYFFQQLQIAV
jgi:hypothetical protein